MPDPSLVTSARKVAPYFVIAALVLVLGVVVLRRAGLLAETVVITSGPAAAAAEDPGGRSLKLVTLLPKDAIPAIFNPEFLDAAAANSQFRDDDLVIGVSINGDHRAYGVANLSSHEVVNDTVGGRPIAVTW